MAENNKAQASTHNSLFSLGVAALRVKNYHAAVEFLQQYIFFYPQSPLNKEARFNLKIALKRYLKSEDLPAFSESGFPMGDETHYNKIFNWLVERSVKQNALELNHENEIKIKDFLSYKVNESPLVSVIFPTFNRDAILFNSVRTVLEQNYTNFELIVVDDGSTDSTREIVTAINDNRVKYLFQKNRGAAAARNLGLAHASGSIIAYLDSDNYWHPAEVSPEIL